MFNVSNIAKLKVSCFFTIISFLILFLFISASGGKHPGQKKPIPLDLRSDTIDILDYTIHLDITDYINKTIGGNCLITLTPRVGNIQKLRLDLLKLNIDSIRVDGQMAVFVYNDTLIDISLPTVINMGDTVIVDVHYSGTPQMDGGGSGWGGFYFQGNYAYNLGVGFQANPHNYGRVWFPCFDNFVERSTYQFHITTDSAKKAFCNGLLQSETNNTNGTTTWYWKMDETIPTYLASVAVADYTTVNLSHTGISGQIPITFAARAADTIKMKNSFTNLSNALAAFENAFGPHRFSRVGFTVVPFNSGAMEHATNISYPLFAVNGNKTYETLFAHELAHHWWGDLVTCESAEDMWLNEGWARYSEMLFLEYVYGEERYKDKVRANHEDVLHYAHVNDNGYRALSGIPHAYTYGDHSYNKGGDVAHTLRAYLGDTLFFNCIRSFMSTYAFQSMNSIELRNHLTNCSGIDLTGFFDNWVFSPGYPHFSIDSFKVIPHGNIYNTTVYIRQRIKSAPAYFKNVPLEVTFFDQNWEKEVVSFNMKGQCTILKSSLLIEPIFAAIDFDERISDAITDEYKVIYTTGQYNFNAALMEVDVISLSDSALLRIEHHWVPPDRMKQPIQGLILSDNRYWKVDGLLPPSFSATAKILYDGRASMSGGYLDNTLISNSEDSIILMYRRNPGAEWKEVNDYNLKVTGSKFDKRGSIDIHNLILGEYTLAIYDATRSDTVTTDIPSLCDTIAAGNDLPAFRKGGFIIYPNPVSNEIMIEIGREFNYKNLLLYNIKGELIFSRKLGLRERIFSIDTTQFHPGNYLVVLEKKNGKEGVKKLVIIH